MITSHSLLSPAFQLPASLSSLPRNNFLPKKRQKQPKIGLEARWNHRKIEKEEN
jgi:hypothetical protein